MKEQTTSTSVSLKLSDLPLLSKFSFSCLLQNNKCSVMKISDSCNVVGSLLTITNFGCQSSQPTNWIDGVKKGAYPGILGLFTGSDAKPSAVLAGGRGRPSPSVPCYLCSHLSAPREQLLTATTSGLISVVANSHSARINSTRPRVSDKAGWTVVLCLL